MDNFYQGQKPFPGTFLVVQWVRLCASNAGGPGSIPGQRTRSSMHAATKNPHATTKNPHAAMKIPRTVTKSQAQPKQKNKQTNIFLKAFPRNSSSSADTLAKVASCVHCQVEAITGKGSGIVTCGLNMHMCPLGL